MNRKWEEFLTPNVTQEKLVSASLYITAFELLKTSIIERIRSFYVDGYDERETIISAEYKNEVLFRNTSTLYASLNWLLENNVINEADLKTFERLKSVRNTTAHKLPHYVSGELDLKHAESFGDLISLLRKIETWWIVNFELSLVCDSENAIDSATITPGPVLMLEMMISVLNGDEDLLSQYQKKAREKENFS